MSSTTTKPIALIILDGWGHTDPPESNAIALAHTPYYDEICANYPMTTLAPAAAGAEAGHMNIGTGRNARSESDVVTDAIRSGAFFENELLVKTFSELAASSHALHLMGLLSDGGVHSTTETLFALLRMAKRAGLASVFVHGILDGVDVPARTADVYVEALEIKLADIGVGKIATLCGRHFAMDSQERWERTARAFTMLVHAEGELSNDAVGSIRNSFLRGISDEFIAPIVMEYEPNVPVARIGNGDTIIFFNHRPDGMRQLVRSVSVPDSSGAVKPIVTTVCLSEYDRDFGLPVAFPTEAAEHVLSEVLGEAGIASFKISQSERFPHVTYYFNGGTEIQQTGETQILVPSVPSDTGEVQPESQSFKITDKFLRAAESAEGGVFVVNIPAAGLAAASGTLDKTIDAVQFVDTCVGGILKYIHEAGGTAMVTSSHSKLEAMAPANGSEAPAATDPNSVPFHLIGADSEVQLRTDGTLADIAPTILGILGIEKPAEMTGSDLRVG